MTLFADDIFNLADLIGSVAAADPGRISVIEPDGRDPSAGARVYRRYTYEQLSRDAESVAVGLREIGVAERTRTVFMAPPSYRACVIGAALTRVGATTIWIDPAVGYRNVGERLRRLEPEAFVGIPLAHLGRVVFGWGSRTAQTLITTSRWQIPGTHTIESLARRAPDAPAPPAVSPDDPVAILYTTGSTGPAKPVLYLHRNFSNVYRTVHRSWRFAERAAPPVDLAAFPAFGFIALSAGGTVVVPPIDFARQGPADADPEAMLEVINDCGVTSMFASPALLDRIARDAARRGVETPTLTRVIGGGAPITASMVKPLLEMLGDGGEVSANYGATEALPATELGARECLDETWPKTEAGAGICVGRPFEGVDIAIIPIVESPIASIEEVTPLGTGEIGEIAIRGAHVSPAYAGDEKNTRWHKIADGGGLWHRVGDAGYLDDRGRLWVCGRVSQRVETAAGPLFPLQVEPVVNAHPAVRRSGLVGVAGEPIICVELEAEFGAGDRDRIRDQLLALAAPSGVETVLFRRRLPVDPRHNSKIARDALARWAARRLAHPRWQRLEAGIARAGAAASRIAGIAAVVVATLS